MKFSVGWFPGFVEKTAPYADKIDEVYFAFGEFPSGRAPVRSGENGEEKQACLLSELADLKQIKHQLLLNGNCYGDLALSRTLYESIGDTVQRLKETVGLDGVTTTSPLIARFLHENFPGLPVRASVNMSIGTVQGLEYVKDVFDSFYLSRDMNYDRVALMRARAWCDRNGKELCGLANSGCLRFCSAHTFHDNLVAHEAGISRQDNGYEYGGQCRTFFSSPENRARWLSCMTLIRPEDTGEYEGLFDHLKLATRIHRNPGAVIRAYASGHYAGPLTALLEPDHTALFYPQVIENSLLPNSFARQKKEKCTGDCENCRWCDEIQKTATVSLT